MGLFSVKSTVRRDFPPMMLRKHVSAVISLTMANIRNHSCPKAIWWLIKKSSLRVQWYQGKTITQGG
jgi:hypothetical protein